MRPLKVAVFHANRDSSYLTRCHAPTEWLKRNCVIELIPPMKAWTADVVLLHGQWQPSILAVTRSLQRHGIRVIADVDEDIFSAPAQHPLAQTFRDPQFQKRARELLETVDAVFTPTGFLAGKLARFNPKSVVTPNGLDLAVWKRNVKPPASGAALTIGFSGGLTHGANFDLLHPVLAKLSGKLKEQDIRFVCFGLRPPWLSGVVSGAHIIPPSQPQEYANRLGRLGIDIALLPLANNDFNKCRSALKFREYAAAGAVTIASNLGSYAAEIEDGVTGLLVDQTPDSWIQAISKLIRSSDLRAALRTAAQESLHEHDLSKSAPAFLEALEATQPDRSRELFALPRTQAPQKPSEKSPNVDIVIPIYNAPVLTRQAIEAALPELNTSHRLVLVDDASPDPEIATVLDDYEGLPFVTVHRSKHNRGFVGTCNLAVLELARQDADVILMNSDTQPMRGFVQRLADTAASNLVIGTVTAVSNHGSIATVPDVADAAALAAELENPLVIALTGVGHLMYIKREAIAKYGLFDMAFSPGYGEEVDFCMRISKEYTHVLDTGCWCWHKGSASFRESVNDLKIAHQAMINERYPHFQFEVEAYHATDPLLNHRRRMLAASRDPRPRVLQVMHSYESRGGTEKHVQDLEAALKEQFLHAAVAPHDSLKLYSGATPVGKWPYQQAGWPLTTADLPETDAAWLGILGEFKPQVIHFHHLLHHPLNLLAKLTDTGIPVIVSIHDYFFVCPDYTLEHCPGLHSCDTCFPERFKGPAEYQTLRRALLGASLQRASAIVAPSRSAARFIQEVYPDLDIRIVPHGIREIPAVTRKPSETLRFGMIGNVTSLKGIEIILKAWPMVAQGGAAELHIYGASSDPRYIERCREAGMHYHGAYLEGDLPRILSEIDIGLLPSQAPETFCYTLSEYFAGGVPVVGSDHGSLSERIVEGVNGLKLPRNDPRAWAGTISRLIQDPDLRARIAAGVRPPVSIVEMAEQYSALYQEMIARRNAGGPAMTIPASDAIVGAPVLA